MEDSSNLINIDDFNSMEIEIQIVNSTTQMPIRGKKKGISSRIVEILEKGLVIEVPCHACAIGHYLLIDLLLTQPDRSELRFSTTVRVEDKKQLETTDQITVELVQYKENEWKKLCNRFSSRQDEILKFFSGVKD